MKRENKGKVDEIRRKLLKLGFWSVPVIIAFTSRKLWAGSPKLRQTLPGEREKQIFEEEKGF